MEKNETVDNLESNLYSYWLIIKRFKWMIAAFCLVVVATVTIGSLMARKVYASKTIIQIERETPNIVSFKEIYQLDAGHEDFYQTQYKLLQCRSLARRVINTMDLKSHPKFLIEEKPNLMKQGIAYVSDLMNMQSAGTGHRSGADRRFRNQDQSDQAGRVSPSLVTYFLNGLVVNPVKNSRLVEISYNAYDPELSAQVANQVAESFIEMNIETKFEATEQATGFLYEQIESLKQEIVSMENVLQKYSQETEIISPNDEQNITIKKLNELSSAYTRSQTERIKLEARYNQLKKTSSGAQPEVYTNRLIQDLKANYAALEREDSEMSKKFKPDWPEMIRLKSRMGQAKRRLETEEQRIFSGLLKEAKDEYESVLNREQSLMSILGEQKQEAMVMNRNAFHFNSLMIEINEKKKLLESLLRRQSETGVSARLKGLKSSNVRIVDRAEIPSKASQPKTKQNIILGLFVGLIGGMGIAFCIDYLDNTLKNSNDVSRYLQLPVLGMIPIGKNQKVKREGKSKQPKKKVRMEVISLKEKNSMAAEAFRSLRTALLLSSVDNFPKIVLTTSCQPKDGKSTCSLNLAIIMAQAGKKTLLIDCDLRKPSTHRYLRLSNQEGLSNYLVSSSLDLPHRHKTAQPNLEVLTSGPIPPNPAELIGSEKFKQMLWKLKSMYDHILLDSTPILFFSEAQELVSLSSGVILVIKSGVTSRSMAKKGKEKLLQARGNIYGVVLNYLDYRHEYTYYYGKSYYRYYSGKQKESTAKSA